MLSSKRDSFISDWDRLHCEKHVINLITNINPIIKNHFDNICLIDIGANVGKVYDLLKQHINIDEVYMFEPNGNLYRYLIKKYKDNINTHIYHSAVFSENRSIYFDESSMDYQIDHLNKSDEINFGLSKISNDKTSNVVNGIKISTFFQENNHLYNKKCFIKIDTETFDYQILEDLYSVITNFIYKPIIEFENNYYCLGNSLTWAQSVIDKYVDIGYKEITVQRNMGDGILEPLL